MGKSFVRKYILDSSLLDHNIRNENYSPSKIFGPTGKLKGYAWLTQPYEGYGNIVYVTTPGKSRTVFNNLLDWLTYDKWKNYVFDKWIEIRPSHTKMYQSVIGQKYDLQARIKQALVSISQSVADLELLEHDIRKYEEFEGYLDGMEKDTSNLKKDEKKKAEQEKKFSEMAIKTVFVDQVDYHSGGTGQGPGRLSMAFMRNNNIMPTIVDDFMIMRNPDDLENGTLKNISTVEKNMLRVKWKAYQSWLNSFKSEVKNRLSRLIQLKRSREKTLTEFREWAKPILARELAIKEGFSEESNRTFDKLVGTEYSSLGEPIALTSTNLLSFRRLSIEEYQKTPSEMYQRDSESIPELADFYDTIAKIMIFDENVGLRVKYPWITKQWVDSVKDECAKKVKGLMLGGFSRYMMMSNINYISRNTIYRGDFEVEIGVFNFDNFMITPNLVFVKMVEHKAKDEEIKRYINQMLGIKDERRTLKYTIKNGKYVVTEKPKEKLSENIKTDNDTTFRSYDDLLKKYSEEKYKIEFVPQKSSNTFNNIFNLKFDFLNHLFPSSGEYTPSSYDDYIYKKFRKVKGLKIFFKPTPYEKDFFDRIAQFHMVNVGIKAGKMRNVIKKLMNVPGI